MLNTDSCDSVIGQARIAEDFCASQLRSAAKMLWDTQEHDVAMLNWLQDHPLKLTSDIRLRAPDRRMTSAPTCTPPSQCVKSGRY